MSPRYERRQGGGGAMLLLIAAAALVVAVLAIFTDLFNGKKASDTAGDDVVINQPAEGQEPAAVDDKDTDSDDSKDGTEDGKDGQDGDTVPVTPSPSVTTTKPASSNTITTDAKPYQSGGVYVVGNAGYEMYNYVESIAANYQTVVNSMADTLKGVSNVYVMAIPLSSGITLPDALYDDIPRQQPAAGGEGYFGGNGAKCKDGAPV